MQRSHINKEIEHAKELFDRIGFKLPPFSHWTVQDWQARGSEIREILDNRLGWDVTDYGSNDFDRKGLLLFTIRNGNSRQKDKYPKTYAEKLMICKQGQTAPLHFHWKKKEDIINRGGGNLVMVLYGSDPGGNRLDTPLSVSIDGVKKTIAAGEKIILEPGESIFLEPFVYHLFYADPGRGAVVIGEVSEVNDDENDNRFFDPIGRFPLIEEDEAPLHLLCTDYDTWLTPSP